LLETAQNRRFGWWGVLFAIALASTFFRFHGLTQNGIQGADTFQYWEIVFHWLGGLPAFTDPLDNNVSYFRPLFFFTNYLAVKVFGLKDWAIRAYMGGAETVNLILLGTLGYRLIRPAWFSLLAVLLYACCSASIHFSQTELPHTFSTVWLLGALHFLVSALDPATREGRREKVYLAAAGALLGCGSLVHSSLMFWGPGLALVVALRELGTVGAPKQAVRPIVTGWVLLAVGFGIPFLLAGAIFGFSTMFGAYLSEAGVRGGGALANPLKLWLYFYTEGPRHAFGQWGVYLLWVGLLVALVESVRRSTRDWRGWILPVLMLTYTFLYAVVLKNVFYTRLYVPMIPVAFLIITHGLSAIRHVLPWRPIWVTAAMALAALSVHSDLERETRYLMSFYRGEQKGGPRWAFEAIGAKVNAGAKLLVGPQVQYLNRRQYTSRMYFADNAVYLFDCKTETFAEFVRRHKINYVMLTKPIEWEAGITPQSSPHLGRCVGISPAEYQGTLEVDRIRELLRQAGAEQILTHEEYGELYRISKGA
jgi:hypothetical protein